MADIDVFADVFEFAFAANRRIKGFVIDRCCELAMGDEICVAADGRREVSVDFRGETIVAEFWVCLRA